MVHTRRRETLGRRQAKHAGTKVQKKEEKVQEAVLVIQSKRFKNVREASEHLGIPEQATTIRRRLNGTARPAILSQAERQLLNATQEDHTKFDGNPLGDGRERTRTLPNPAITYCTTRTRGEETMANGVDASVLEENDSDSENEGANDHGIHSSITSLTVV
ncbi:hypothetical protein B0H14DRAFT_2580116 [Mycena olivaceomarginata]|nr:hypothetical protein B0H14DRAFT_2580116 [Mycena olivaceomarginata]